MIVSAPYYKHHTRSLAHPFMSDLDMDAALSPLDLSRVPSNFIHMILQSMSLIERFTCALVCKAWAEAATAATRSIILRDSVQDLSCFQRWLDKHGDQVQTLQLHKLLNSAVLAALPCPQLQDLLLSGNLGLGDVLSLDSRVWSDIAAATKFTSVSLEWVQTASQQADVVSALTALPDLEQLAWWGVECKPQWGLTDSLLLQKLTKLTALKLDSIQAVAALEHLGLLTGLQDLSLAVTADLAATGCPGLQELKALTRLDIFDTNIDITADASQLTALQQLHVPGATSTALNKLAVLTGLTCLYVQSLTDMTPGSPPLQLPGLQHFIVSHQPWQAELICTMPMSFLGNCTQLRVLRLSDVVLSGPGSLAANSMLQHLELERCWANAADGAAGPVFWQHIFPAIDPVSWQQVFPGPGQLPWLTSLKMTDLQPNLHNADMECVVACCSNLQVFKLDTIPDSVTSALTRLSGLTSLMHWKASDQQCRTLAQLTGQLTGLRDLRLYNAHEVSAAGLRQLAALEQLTSLGLHHLGSTTRRSSDVLREHMSDRLPGPFTYKYAIINKAPAGQPPDVSARLLRACDMATAADS